MKRLKLLILPLLIPLLSSCSSKTYTEVVPYKFQKLEKIEPLSVKYLDKRKEFIVVDTKLYIRYITMFRDTIRFYEEQIEDYEDSLDESNK